MSETIKGVPLGTSLQGKPPRSRPEALEAVFDDTVELFPKLSLLIRCVLA